MIPIGTIGSHGMAMPKLGLGTWKMLGAECEASVARAITLGYRHIDTAAMYDNEDAVGAGIAASGLPRGDIFLTTKVWHENLAPDAMRRSIETSLGKLKTGYVDLFLIHWPSPSMNLKAALETMANLKAEGLIRNAGVANFTVPLLRQAVETIGADIACNQIEYHLLLDQSLVLDYARSQGIAIIAYCPLAQGRLADYSDLAGIAAKHGVTTAQVALKYLLDQEGVAAIPKAAREESQRANLAALAIPLDDEDRAVIAALPKNHRFINPSFAPEWDRAA
ncbi:MAG: aldo/keto reductase [Acidiphilium sp.]|nr:aldo/keto reductase [Acidiphilium sp.]MDD4935661.1 aldo/keto reductase [Acidiphilium sp.]